MLEADVTKSGNLDRNRLDDRHRGMVGIHDRLLVFDHRRLFVLNRLLHEGRAGGGLHAGQNCGDQSIPERAWKTERNNREFAVVSHEVTLRAAARDPVA